MIHAGCCWQEFHEFLEKMHDRVLAALPQRASSRSAEMSLFQIVLADIYRRLQN